MIYLPSYKQQPHLPFHSTDIVFSPNTACDKIIGVPAEYFKMSQWLFRFLEFGAKFQNQLLNIASITTWHKRNCSLKLHWTYRVRSFSHRLSGFDQLTDLAVAVNQIMDWWNQWWWDWFVCGLYKNNTSSV